MNYVISLFWIRISVIPLNNVMLHVQILTRNAQYVKFYTKWFLLKQKSTAFYIDNNVNPVKFVFLTQLLTKRVAIILSFNARIHWFNQYTHENVFYFVKQRKNQFETTKFTNKTQCNQTNNLVLQLRCNGSKFRYNNLT